MRNDNDNENEKSHALIPRSTWSITQESCNRYYRLSLLLF